MMEMDTDAEATLRKLAAGDTMDYSTWPLVLAIVVSRLEKTAIKDFPIPRIPKQTAPPPPPSPEPRFLAPLPPSSDGPEPASSSSENDASTLVASSGGSSNTDAPHDTNKENAPPLPARPAPPPVPAAPAPEPELELELELEPGTLPPQITAMIAEITGVLNETFHTYPPHTIQRLSELVLEPRKHYKSLPAYLHAVDRVVHVTSGNNIYPLPPALSDLSHLNTVNGTTPDSGHVAASSTATARDGSIAGDASSDLPTQTVWGASHSSGAPIGSDEALGGALLTPIPWLAKRAANGGDGSSESGESSNMGSEASSNGPSAAPTVTSSAPGAQTRQGRGPYEMQVRTESTETIDGPNGMGSIETVSVSINGVSSMSVAQQQRVISQGELIRQEQRAGVVPVNRSMPIVVTSTSPTVKEEVPDTTMGEGDADGASRDSNSEQSDDDMADDEEAPHARGPDLIGAADMGPQTGSNASSFSISHAGNPEVHGIDIEAAVGRKHESHVPQQQHPDGASAGVTPSECSDDAVMITPTSSEAETPAPETEIVEQTAESERKEEAVAIEEEQKNDKVLRAEESTEPVGPEDQDPSDTGPKSTTLSAGSIPVKREAEYDISEAEAEPKRLKSSTLDYEDGTPSRSEGAVAEGASEPAAPSEPLVRTEDEESTAATAVSAEVPQPESKDQKMDDSQGAVGSEAPNETVVSKEQADRDGDKDGEE